MSIFQRMLEALKVMLGKRIDFDNAYGFQCVDYARWYAHHIGHPIGFFGGSAYNGFSTGNPIKNTKWKKVVYTGKEEPNVGDIIFFDKSKENGFYGHVAVVYAKGDGYILVNEQNAGSGNGDGLKSNAIKSTRRTYKYVIGWFTLP